MNWHETIQAIRQDPSYGELVKLAYFDADLPLNVKRFGQSEELFETLALLKTFAPNAKSLLDVGAGNGVSSANFALQGYHVSAVEPDSSDSVGVNAIRYLKDHFQLSNLTVFEGFCENIGFENGCFDVVYVRQAMHHAYDLDKFILQCARVLKPGGILMTIRDHVVFDEEDKAWFLQEHPLQKFYGGENAFRPAEYRQAMLNAGLTILKEIKFYDSIINYFPLPKQEVQALYNEQTENLKHELRKKIGVLAAIPGLLNLYRFKNRKNLEIDERSVPGRMYSYVARK